MRGLKHAWLIILFFIILMPSSACRAVSVDTFKELKKELEKAGTASISVTKNITMSGVIHVRGNKTLDGQGKYTLNRKSKEDAQYYGVLLEVGKESTYSASLTVQNITIHGKCSEATMTHGATGRLIRVVQTSNLVLEAGTVLTDNKNSTDFMDGGGGITITSGCTGEMRSTSKILSNRSMTGGGGVRVESGASFTMKDGSITGNEASLHSYNNDYEGRGGGIHNAGTLILQGGELTSNIATGDTGGGGVGGGRYNPGELVITNTSITGNHAATGGGGIYSTGVGSKLLLSGGRICANVCNSTGGGCYINNGGALLFDGGEIAENVSGTGGGIYLSKENSSMTMSGGYIYGNSALNGSYSVGGGLRNNGASLTIKGGVFGRNSKNENHDNSCPNTTSYNYSSNLHNSGILKLEGGLFFSLDARSKSIVNTGYIEWSPQGESAIFGNGAAAILNNAKMVVGQDARTAACIDGDFNNGIENHDTLEIYDCRITVKENGIRNSETLRILGGRIEAKYGVNAVKGRFELSGAMKIDDIYLADDQCIYAMDKIDIESCVIHPESYKEGRVLLQSQNLDARTYYLKQFELARKVPYSMEAKGRQLFIHIIRYAVHFDGNGGIGKMDDLNVPIETQFMMPRSGFKNEGCIQAGWSIERFDILSKSEGESFSLFGMVEPLANEPTVVTLYAVWVAVPKIQPVYDEVSFYEGEYVDKELLLLLVTATDRLEGNITDKVWIDKISYPDREDTKVSKLYTFEENIGDIKIHYKCKNAGGQTTFLIMKVKLLANLPPVVEVKDRFFFLDEVEKKTTNDMMKELFHTVSLNDDVEPNQDLMQGLMNIGEPIVLTRPGGIVITLSVKDQYGHRFYMKPNEKRWYGSGKRTNKTFTLHIIGHTSQPQEAKHGYVRFITKAYLNTLGHSSKWKTADLSQRIQAYLEKKTTDNCVSVWKFDNKQIKQIKALDESGDDLFGELLNYKFLDRFHPVS